MPSVKASKWNNWRWLIKDYMTFLRWKKEREKFSLKAFLSLKNFSIKKTTTYTCFLISLYLLHTRKGNFFERWYSSVHPVYVMEIFSTFQLLTFNFAFFFRYKVHLQIIINICLQGVIACKAALSCIQELKRACLLPCISVPFSEW